MSDIFSKIRDTALGIDACVPVIDLAGNVTLKKRVYLDSAATCLAVRPVADVMGAYFSQCTANSHTLATSPGRDTTDSLHEAHADLGKLLGYDPNADCVLMCGTGTTAATCFIAECLKARMSVTPERGIAIVSSVEHHSNLLPWMRSFDPVYVYCDDDGMLDIEHLKKLLAEYGPKTMVVAVTAVSNVTGVITPLAEIARLAHEAGAYVYVDAAQGAAHIEISKARDGLDFVAGSGHKMYAPGSPGWVIAPISFLKSLDWSVGMVGGGTVDRVELSRVWLKEDPTERYEAGTPNIPGTIALGASARMLREIGMDQIREHERLLVNAALAGLEEVPGLVMYGPRTSDKKTALVSFNVSSIPHGIVSAYLNDYFAIMTRNDCFCAQPYVRRLVNRACEARGYCEPIQAGKTGMVRASFGLYTGFEDIQTLVDALKFLVANREAICSQYVECSPGSWQHKRFRGGTGFDYRKIVDRFVEG